MVGLLLLPLTAAGQSALAKLMGPLRWGMSPARVQEQLGGEASVVSSDPSWLRAEREHGDLVMERRDAMSRRFYLYRAGKLRMLFIAYDALAFPEGNFAAFAAHLERSFGPGTRVQQRIEWRERSTRVRALVRQGVYCLVLERSG